MDLTVITEQEIDRRRYWIDEISRLIGNFGVDSDRVEQEIAQEIETNQFLVAERERIMRLSRQEAIREVLKWRKIESRIRAVELVADNGLLGFE